MVVGCVIPGAGAFEVALHNSLVSPDFLKNIKGRARLGIQVLILILMHVTYCNINISVYLKIQL